MNQPFPQENVALNRNVVLIKSHLERIPISEENRRKSNKGLRYKLKEYDLFTYIKEYCKKLFQDNHEMYQSFIIRITHGLFDWSVVSNDLFNYLSYENYKIKKFSYYEHDQNIEFFFKSSALLKAGRKLKLFKIKNNFIKNMVSFITFLSVLSTIADFVLKYINIQFLNWHISGILSILSIIVLYKLSKIQKEKK